MKRIFLIALFAFSIFYIATQSSNAITPEQHYMNQETARREYANAMQRTHDMLDRSIAAANDGKNVTQTASSSMSASTGAKVTGGGSVTKPINPSAVAKAIVSRLDKAKALGKASLPSFLGSAALTGLLNAVGWVIDEGGKVTRKEGATGDYKGFIFSNPNDTNKYVYYSPEEALDAFYVETCNNGHTQYCYHKSVTCPVFSAKPGSTGTITCTIVRRDNFNYTGSAFYKPDTSVGGNVEVPATEIQSAITNYITNNTTNNITKTIVNNAYSYDGSNGQNINSPSNELAKEASKDITNAIDSSVNNPTDPKRPGYYKITDGTKTVEGYVTPSNTATDTKTDSTSTTTNPDGSTSTTTGSGSSESLFPAFCDWASIVCDWYKDWKTTDEWMKEEPELKDEPLEIEEQDITAYERKDYVEFGKTCPFVPKEYSLPFGVGAITFQTDLTFICTFAEGANPYIRGFGYLGALIYLLLGLRNQNA